MPICRKLDKQTVLLAELRAEAKEGRRIEISNAMIPITTSNSINENAFLARAFMMDSPQ
jgi:hypothetical protein